MGDGRYDRSDRGTRVYVGGLMNSVTKEDLQVEFGRYGKLNSVWVALNPPGFAFVEFAEKEDAQAACDSLNNTEILGSVLRVELSRARRRAPGGPRGGFGGGGRGGGGRGGFGFRQRGGPRGGGGGGAYPRSRSPFHSRGYGGDSGFNRNRGGEGSFPRNNYANSSY